MTIMEGGPRVMTRAEKKVGTDRLSELMKEVGDQSTTD
jgi:CMP-2-keto-3-deoxyoctulosonic acid synthetase